LWRAITHRGVLLRGIVELSKRVNLGVMTIDYAQDGAAYPAQH
jgi:hypothetical protein